MPGQRADDQGNRVAELRVEPLQRAAPTGVGALVGGGAVTVLQQVPAEALPPGRNPEPDIDGDGEPDPLTTLGQPEEGQAAGRPGATDAQRQPGAALLPSENPAQLGQAEQERVQRLLARDAAVRSEEESHQAVAGAFAGPIQYDYTRGPDNRLYVTGGSVNMSVAGITNPDVMAGALRSMQSAGSIPGATSVADSSATASASRNLSNLLLAQSGAEQEANQAQLAQQAYASAGQLSAQGNGVNFASGGLGASVNFASTSNTPDLAA